MEANRKSAAGEASGEVDRGRLSCLLGYHLRRAHTAAFQSFARAMAGDGVSPGRLGVLLLVAANPGINQTRLGRALGIDRSTLVAMLDRLGERDLVARARSPADRRSPALTLTRAGERFLEQLTPRLEGHEDEIAGNLSAQERRLLIELLGRVVDSERT